MIKDSSFRISRKPYAVDLSTLRGTSEDTPKGRNPSSYSGVINAVWFRRRSGLTIACIGTLWDHQYPTPVDAVAFLVAHEDGRYGGNCHGRWDGESYWGNVTLDVQNRHLTVLRPMLSNYPKLPPGYDGWWRF